jgi:hypothetical protein
MGRGGVTYEILITELEETSLMEDLDVEWRILINESFKKMLSRYELDVSQKK